MLSKHAQDTVESSPDFLKGGGEMGALMRSHDWSGSSLGSPALWPQPLRTVVRLMLNTGHPMYIWWGADLTCLYNDAYRESIGPERHPGSLGRPAREVWDEIWDVIHPQIEQVMSGRGGTWNVNHLVPITRRGRLEDVYWTYSYSPIDDETAPHGIGGVLVVCTETTRQVALAESEARFRSALKAGRMGSWETDYQTMSRSWTAEGMALFGLTLPEGRGQVGGANDEYLAALHPDDRHQGKRLHELADRQDAFAAEYRIIRPDGSTLWLSGRGLVVERDADGRALRLVSIMADATEGKHAEAQLHIERERLSLALRAGRMGAYELNLNDQVLWWSPQMYALFGVDADRFVPTAASADALIHPDDRKTFARGIADAIAQHLPLVHEFRVLHPDGTQVWLALRGQVEYDAANQPLRSFGIAMDITERKRIEDVLLDADRKKDRFIAILAHELRNPLAPIRNATYLLRRTGSADSTAAWCHDVIDRQVTQMARLLDDLLDVSRLSRGQLRLRLQPMMLAMAIEQAVEIAQPVIEAGGHALTVAMHPQPLALEGDLTRLAQVFSNILINAAKYTAAKGRIELTVDRRGDQAIVSVTDSGIGIAAQHLSRIFEMFGQVESETDRSQGGQGIGLSLAKGLVEMHGGQIRASSEGLGKGSQFVVSLPLAPATSTFELPSPGAGSPASATTKFRILIADDLRDASDSLALLLRAMGHVVAIAYDGEEALRLAEASRPDIALLDLGMPKLDGYEVCRRIRAATWGTGMMLVAQTGWGQEHDRQRTREAGFDHHLIKPVDPAALAAVFQRRLQR